MNSSNYKYCIVPLCQSTSIRTPTKIFIYVPNNEEIRRKWLRLARRDDLDNISMNSIMYFCEDHFDLPIDMTNYMQFCIMGSVSQIRMMPNCMPSRFQCQQGLRKLETGNELWYDIKKQRIIIADSLDDAVVPVANIHRDDSN